MTLTVREATSADLPELVRLNEENVPAVSTSTLEHMADLVEWSALAWVLDAPEGDGLAGFILLMEPGSAYTSPNYAWFSERFDRFLYVDRVVVGSAHRGAGLGGELYEAVIAEATRRGAGRVTAEVNLEPPNPGSSRFHRSHGFEPVGVQRFGDDYAVEMLARPVS